MCVCTCVCICVCSVVCLCACVCGVVCVCVTVSCVCWSIYYAIPLQDNIAKHRYHSIDGLEADIVLLCQNTHTYNVEGSQVNNVYVYNCTVSTLFKVFRLYFKIPLKCFHCILNILLSQINCRNSKPITL